MRSIKFFSFSMILSVALLLATNQKSLAESKGPAGAKAFDNVKRVYKLRTVNPEEQLSSERRFFTLTEFEIETKLSALNGDSVLIFTRDEKTKEGVEYHYEFITEVKDLKVLKMKRQIVTADGLVLEDTTHNYMNQKHSYPANTFSFMMLPFVFQTVDLTAGAVTEYYLLFDVEHQPFRIILTVQGPETITAPAGTFECIKFNLDYNKEDMPAFIRIMPNFLLKRMLPSSYVWVDKNAPHQMIRFQGKLEGMGSPEMAQELAEVKK